MSRLKKPFCLTLLLFTLSFAATPKLPIGMNIGSNNYYSTNLVFNDVMKTASSWLTFNATGSSAWNTGKIGSIPLDSNGYPLELPYAVDNVPQAVRFLINSNYKGEYLFLYDGEGDITFHTMTVSRRDGKTYLTLNGSGSNTWIQITRSVKGNHVRNIRIIPVQYENTETVPTFYTPFIKGLEPFHALRFMDWINTNNSKQKSWSDRVTPTYYSQGGPNGMAFEYAIELCNLLKVDGWFCVPHMADDNYIHELARLLKRELDPRLKIYIEYSNEIWNWQFQQAQWVLHNGIYPVSGGYDSTTLANDQYVIDGLKAINPNSVDHPEKDAYMMARLFKIFGEEFHNEMSRIVRVAAVQHAWVDNTRRILKYLFETDGVGADAVSPTAYFNFSESQHNVWNAMNPASVTPQMIIDSVSGRIEAGKGTSLQTAQYGNQYGVDYIVYEGGQHMQPWKQMDWGYNQAVWDAQIHPGMYDLYMQNFGTITVPEVDCKLYMAFSYVGARESKYGSWGHLENFDQLNDMENIKIVAPKYAALLDANTPKEPTTSISHPSGAKPTLSGFKTVRLNRNHLNLSTTNYSINPISVSLYTADGRLVSSFKGAGNVQNFSYSFKKPISSGLYIIKVNNGFGVVSKQMIVHR